VVGNQNGWFVTPHDMLPGSFAPSGSIENATDDSFEMTPNSVWGEYRFKITRTGPADSPTPDLKLRQVVSVRDIHFADLQELTADNTLLFSGTLKTIGEDRKTFLADMGFKDGPLECRLDLIDCQEKKLPPDVRSMRYGPHWQHTMDIYYPKDRGSKPLPIILYIHGGGWGALDKEGVNRSVPDWTKLGFAVVSFNYRFVSNANEYPAMSPPVASSRRDSTVDRGVLRLRVGQRRRPANAALLRRPEGRDPGDRRRQRDASSQIWRTTSPAAQAPWCRELLLGGQRQVQRTTLRRLGRCTAFCL